MPPNSPVFIVGNQRSGTSWLANILNRSRFLSLYYEPFEKELGLFDDFPEEPIYLEAFSASLAARFLNDFDALLRKKKRLLRIDTKQGQAIHATIFELLHRLSGYGVSIKPRFVRQMRVLNQWHGRHLFANFIQKDKAAAPLIKETRLHLKIEAILKELPESKMILLSRHPYPVIKSTVNWFAKGSLCEFRKKMDYFLDVYRTQHALKDYVEVVEKNINADIESKLLVHWIISNDHLMRVADKYPSRVLFLPYESLCKNTKDCVLELADFLQLDFSEMKDYVMESSTTKGRAGIVDTKRMSSAYYKQWMQGVDERLYGKILEYAEMSLAIQRLQSEYADDIPKSCGA